jgi:signal transduction histidine kinase
MFFNKTATSSSSEAPQNLYATSKRFLYLTVQPLLLGFLLAIVLSCGHEAIAQAKGGSPDPLAVSQMDVIEITELAVLPDPDSRLSLQEVRAASDGDRFATYPTGQRIDTRIHTYWLKFIFQPKSPNITEILLDVGQWDVIDAYSDQGNVQRTGMLTPLRDRPVQKNFLNHPLLRLPVNGVTPYLIRVQTNFSTLTTQRPNFTAKIYAPHYLFHMDFGIGIYCGWLIVMALYNLFIYWSVRNSSYLYYTLYLFFFALVWISFFGYGYQYFWTDLPPELNKISSNIVGFPFFFFLVRFAQSFLKTKHYARKIHQGLNSCQILFHSSGILFFSSFWFYGVVANLVAINVALILMLIGGFIAYRRGYRSALFFVVANLVFIVGGIVFNLADLRLIPQTAFTQYSVHIGSAIEVVLFSLGLADMINLLKNEKETAQQQVIEELRKNKELQERVQEELEEKVVERTYQLSQANQDLTDKTQELENTLARLKEAQTKLVESEKLVSLGQLTAGIAHEINNPINFVTSNIESLRLDFQDLQTIISAYQSASSEADLKQAHAEAKALDSDFLFEEVQGLIRGISEGSARTQEIVAGLRTFSRMDEDMFKDVDIHEGIDSTLALLKNKLKRGIQVRKNYGEVPRVECLPGKLNQVFMNILTNAIQAMDDQGEIDITTAEINQEIQISFQDTGSGMDESVKKRIFEPFFTTKPVGEGTGLGLPISYGIIEKHHGRIEVHSHLGQGSTFIVCIPIQQP